MCHEFCVFLILISCALLAPFISRPLKPAVYHHRTELSPDIKETPSCVCQVQPKHYTPLYGVSGGANSPKFAVYKSILAKTHSAGVFFQHIAISRVICLLPQGLLSIEQILWSQLEIPSSSTALSGFVPPRKFIPTMFFPILRLNNEPRPVWIKRVSLHPNIRNVVIGASRVQQTHKRVYPAPPAGFIPSGSTSCCICVLCSLTFLPLWLCLHAGSPVLC